MEDAGISSPARRDALRGGWAAVAAGVIGATAAGILLVLPPMVAPDQFSYPTTPALHVVFQISFFVHHLLMVYALWHFWRAGLAGHGRLSKIAGIASVALMASFAAWELVVITVADAVYPSPETDMVEGVYGILTLVLGLLLTLLGVAALRARSLAPADRWVPLAVGAFVFVPLTPAIFLGFVAGRVTIAVWLLLFAWMGLGMIRWARTGAADRHSVTTVP